MKYASDENKGKYQSGIICWSNTKFSELTQEPYGREEQELGLSGP